MLPQTATPLGKERVCTFGGDPHLTSFLGTRFDLHLEGVYTLLEYGQDVKIQMGIRNCGPNPSWLSGGLKVSCAQELAVQLQVRWTDPAARLAGTRRTRQRTAHSARAQARHGRNAQYGECIVLALRLPAAPNHLLCAFPTRALTSPHSAP
jgi:hypothetical protein